MWAVAAAGTRLHEARCLRRCAYWARSDSLSGLARSDSEEVMECEAVPEAPDPPPVTLRRLALRALAALVGKPVLWHISDSQSGVRRGWGRVALTGSGW
jgi:hypothetical protein